MHIAITQAASPRLRGWLRYLWRWFGAAPITVKVFGLVVLPVFVVTVVGTILVHARLLQLIDQYAIQSNQAQILFDLLEQVSIPLGLVALLGLSLAAFFVRVLVRPLRDIIRAMRRVRGGDLNVQIPVWAPDEIGQVQAEFNRMVNGLRQSQETLLQQQRELERLNGDKSRLLGELETKRQKSQQLLHKAISAQEAERLRLSRELHDETGQALTSILLRLKALQSETDMALIQDRLNGIRVLANQTLVEVRRLAMDLRPLALDSLGLVPAIEWYIQECNGREGVEIGLEVCHSLGRLPTDLEIVLYRAVQEGLTNVFRHAQARHAIVTLDCEGRTVRLGIQDDGKGIGRERQPGLGLEGMRERVELAHGHLEVKSAAGQGTQILIGLPLEGECE